MTDQLNSPIPSTTESTRASVATHVGSSASPAASTEHFECEGEGKTFTLGPGVKTGSGGRPYERRPGDPLYRPLRIYTVDPGTRQDEGAVAVVNVPYEPLQDGIEGSGDLLKGYVFHVMPVFKQPHLVLQGATEKVGINLNDPFLLLTAGRAPSPVDPLFHQQMVYAVASLVYASFRLALGRHVAWRFPPHEGDENGTRLRLSPHARPNSAGASYEPDLGEILFGFVDTGEEAKGRAVPGGQTFTCVSHDIVAHEVTHALIDGLRAYFTEPTNGDVLGFHEGFADVIALLHHFSYTEVVRAAVRRSRGNVLRSALLTSIAVEFGLATGKNGALRSLNGANGGSAQNGAEGESGTEKAAGARLNGGPPDDALGLMREYRQGLHPHEMGQVLVSAVFHAFATVFARKTERYLRLATKGTGVLPPGEIPADLRDVLAEEASQLASQFLNVCIRALDYCPPVDLELGEFLRAVVTADLDLVPDDPWGYREAWIDAFARHRIFPSGVQCMSEDELRWNCAQPEDGKRENLLKVGELSFTKLEFDSDPACAASPYEVHRRACALGQFVSAHPDKFGLVLDGDPALNGDKVTVPEVQSVRTSRRVGPDGQVVFDLVAEVTQIREVEDHFRFLLRGGSTVILGPGGEVRYVISKKVTNHDRVERQKTFMQSSLGSVHVSIRDGWNVVGTANPRLVHEYRDAPRAPERRSEPDPEAAPDRKTFEGFF